MNYLTNATFKISGKRKKVLRIFLLLFLAACIFITNEAEANVTTPDNDSTFVPANLQEQVIYNRAINAIIWSMPAVNYELMYHAMVRETKGSFNQIVYWSRLPSWKDHTLTPNPDAIYLMPFYNTKDAGPMVLEIPPADNGSITGNLDGAWQVPLEDVGPAGIDKGKGGKCLLLPPGYTGKVPAGYIPLQMETNSGYALLRSILNSGSEADIAKAVAYGKRVKLYPLSQAASPQATVFLDAINVIFDAAIPYDLRYFELLDNFVQNEPWIRRDMVMIDQLKSIGIEKGKPFKPDSKMQRILNAAARDAHRLLDDRYEDLFAHPFFDGTHWAFPVLPAVGAGQSTSFADVNAYPTDDRGLTYTVGFVGIKHSGAGQYYLMTTKDKDGKLLFCNKTYHLNVPAKVPVKQYWSATAYDRKTHTLIRNASVLSRSSQSPGLKANADGSVDIYFGPAAPKGKESNWIETGSGENFEVLMRFYGPEKALFDKAWKMADVAEMK